MEKKLKTIELEQATNAALSHLLIRLQNVEAYAKKLELMVLGLRSLLEQGGTRVERR